MKKLLMGCMAALAALISLVGCEQDRVVYGGPHKGSTEQGAQRRSNHPRGETTEIR